MTTETYTTNVTRGHERVKMTAHIEHGLTWAELYVRGDLKGCGPTLAGVGGDILHDCQMRLLDLFEGTMLWRPIAR